MLRFPNSSTKELQSVLQDLLQTLQISRAPGEGRGDKQVIQPFRWTDQLIQSGGVLALYEAAATAKIVGFHTIRQWRKSLNRGVADSEVQYQIFS